VNHDETPLDRYADVVVRESAGEVLDTLAHRLVSPS
jgi:NAD-dependent SIR2 family protein deacetylase